MTEPPVHQPDRGDPNTVDPVLAGFDHLVALAGYALLFVSMFMVGVPALAALALAYAHKGDTDLVARSHFRFQLRIFWTAILFLALAIGSLLTAAALGADLLFHFAQTVAPASGAGPAHAGVWSGVAGLLVLAAVLLAVLAVIWTLGASVFGFVRLLANQPIGHSPGRP